LSYEEWDKRSGAIATGLAATGVDAGNHVALVFDDAHYLEYALCYAAVHKAGAVTDVLAPGWSEVELSRALAEARVAAVIAPEHLVDVDVHRRRLTPAQLEERAGTRMPEGAAEPPELAEVLYRFSPLRRPQARAYPQIRLGSELAPDEFADEGRAELLHAFGLGTDAGQKALRLPLLRPHVSCVAMAHFDVERFCSLVASRRTRVAGLMAEMARALVMWGPVPGSDLSCLERLLVAGPISPAVLAALAIALPHVRISALGEEGESQDPSAGGGPFAEHGRGPAGGPRHQARVPVARTSQLGSLWREQLAPGCSNLPPIAHRISGPLRLDALERAISALISRHEALRTTFEICGAEVMQVIGETPPCIQVEDLTALPAVAQSAEVGRVVTQASARPVDAVCGPLFAPRLLRIAPEEYVLVIATNHMLWDHVSLTVFYRELSELYGAFASGRPSSLPDPAAQFADFARWQRDWLEGAQARAQLAYWNEQLAGVPFGLQLPVEDPSRPRGSPLPPAQPVSIVLPATLVDGLRALSRDEQASVFMTMLAAFAVLVRRCTGLDDLLLPSFVANRSRRQFRDVIGCFAQPVALRLRLDGDPTFAELVHRARDVVLDAVSNQDLPYEIILRDILGAPAAVHGLAPSPSVTFQALDGHGQRLELRDLSVSDVTTPVDDNLDGSTGVVNFTGAGPPGGPGVVWGGGLYRATMVAVSVVTTPESVSCRVEGVFHRPSVERLLHSYQRLLETLVDQPRRRLSEVVLDGDGPEVDVDAPGHVGFRGFIIQPSRVEAALSDCRGVRDVGVIVLPDLVGQPQLVACVVAGGEVAPTLGQLRRHLWSRIPGYIWPAQLALVDALPRRADGSLDDHALVAEDDFRPRWETGEPPRPEAALLASLWARALGRERVGMDDGYWLSVPFLVAAAEARAAGLPVTGFLVVKNRTIEMLATAVAAAAVGESRA